MKPFLSRSCWFVLFLYSIKFLFFHLIFITEKDCVSISHSVEVSFKMKTLYSSLSFLFFYFTSFSYFLLKLKIISVDEKRYF